MQLYFTALPPKKPITQHYSTTTPIHANPTPTKINTMKTSSLQSLDTYSKYTNIAPSNTFSNRLTYFSGTSMFGRVESGVIGCSSCGLKKS